VLPYANLNERRDAWRKDFFERFMPLVKDADSASEAAEILNREVFKTLNVSYHATKRPKPDQSPHESMEVGFASCTGLSVLLVDACRAVGVPARVVGTPLWADGSGNHTWVEVWDGRWKSIGAAEPGVWDGGWFMGQAAKAVADDPARAIYAASFARTGTAFRMVWLPGSEEYPAVNVTKWYQPRQALKVRVRNRMEGEPVRIRLREGSRIVCAADGPEAEFQVACDTDYVASSLDFRSSEGYVLRGAGRVACDADATIDLWAATADTLAQLEAWLKQGKQNREPLAAQAFTKNALTKAEAVKARKMLLASERAELRAERQTEWINGEIVLDGKSLKFKQRTFGAEPFGGWNLFISMHGGGNAPPEVNDQQWQNQVRLYEPENSLYIAPRAPTDTWNLWHEGHIDDLFDRLIEDAIVLGGANPDRVYLMGYSAGGDGVYQLAPRMADRFAAAAMMAGHPNDASPLSLRNLPFAIHMGAEDGAYNRNTVATEWGKKLEALRAADGGGYKHFVKLHEGMGHWMKKQDAEAIEWMKGFTRNLTPSRVVWQQSGGRLHSRFYWLEIPIEQAKAGEVVVASYEGQTVTIERAEGIEDLTIWLRDGMVDLDLPLRVVMGEKVLFEGKVPRTIEAIDASFARRGDWLGWFEGRVGVSLREETAVTPAQSESDR